MILLKNKITFLVGTYRIRNEDVLIQSIDYALAAGYRMIGKYSFKVHSIILALKFYIFYQSL